MSTVPPSTRGVKWKPEAMVKSPLHVHPLSTCESAPSAAMSKGSCATTLPPPPIDDASSIDLEYTYVAPKPSPFASRLRRLTDPACRIELAAEDSYKKGCASATTIARSTSSLVPFAPL